MQIKARKAKNIFEKSWGLMFENDPKPLYFETRWGIHTFFVNEPLGVIVLDDSSRVVRIKTVKPNRIFFWNPKYKRVIELPEKMLRQTKIRLDEELEIHFRVDKF